MPPKKEVPFIIKQASKAVDEDLRPTLHLLGKIFFDSWPAKPAPREATTSRASKPLRLPPNQQIIVVQKPAHKAAGNGSYVRPGENVIDAEVIDDSEISRGCPTCGGNGKLGRSGHEVPCPSCSK
jgi:hypothetical protein